MRSTPTLRAMTYHSTNKYHAKKVKTEDGTFDSQKELNRWCQLKLLERAYQITGLERQVKFPIIAKSKFGGEIVYIADFVYYEDGKKVIEDVKGYKTAVYKLKKRLVAEQYGIEVRET